MYIPIELKVGCIAFGICVAEKDAVSGWPMQNLILGVVSVISQGPMGERDVTIRADHPKPMSIVLPEWRIAEFDFGGVPVPNPWFDQDRIEEEDETVLGDLTGVLNP